MLRKINLLILVFVSTIFTVISPASASVKEGWVRENNSWHYYANGRAYTGWHWMTEKEGEKISHWSYFGKDGKLRTGWNWLTNTDGEKTPHWSYFGDNGWLRTGWAQLGKGTNNPDGNAEKHWSYFGDNGWLKTGWVQLGKGTSNPDGNSEKHWSYFGDNGWLRTGWAQLGKGTANPDGNAAKHWSYFGVNGWLRTGLQEMGTANNPDGNAVKHLSYFGNNGWLVENTKVKVGSTEYISDSKGWLTPVVNASAEKKVSFVSLRNRNRDLSSLKGEVKTLASFMIEHMNKGTKNATIHVNDSNSYKEATAFIENGYFSYIDGPFYSYSYDDVSRNRKSTAGTFTFNGELSKEYARRDDIIYNWVKSLSNTIFKRGMTEKEAVRAIDTWFRNSYRYTSGQNLWDAYNNKGGTCATYSQLTKALCDMVGIECKEVSGTVAAGYHAWNRIKINGVWYYFDYTWNVAYPASANKYFMSAKPFADHTVTQES